MLGDEVAAGLVGLSPCWGMALFAIWPFTRLVHAFSAPVGYLFRPYILYRSRAVAKPGEPVGSRPRRRGW